MGYFDFINELRKAEPDVKKAAKAMKIVGWICVFTGLWNFVMIQFTPIKEGPFNIPPDYPYIALFLLLVLSVMFFYSYRGIKEGSPWGKRLGQISAILLVIILIGLMFFFINPIDYFPSDSDISIFFIIFFVVFLAQFCVPAYFAVRYLGRLPVREHYADLRFGTDSISGIMESRPGTGQSTKKYKEALLPFGLFGNLAVLILIPMVIIFLIQKTTNPSSIGIFIIPATVFIFLGLVIYNYIPSTFQQNRQLIASNTGGGSIFLFNASWPFFRLLIYKDGLEVRVMLHRYFIPYDKIEDIPEKIEFFSRGILIKSNLSDVPSSIRFQGFGMKKIAEVMNSNKNNAGAG